MKKQIIISFIFIVNLHCSSSLSIDAQIAQIKKAPESERVALMNQFKRDLILMNQKERETAIAQLQNNASEEPIPIENSLPTQSNEMIYTLQQSNIEQSVQIERAMNVEEQIQEHQILPIPTQSPLNEQPNINNTPQGGQQESAVPNTIPNSRPQQSELPVETANPNTPVSQPENQQPEIQEPNTSPSSNPVEEVTTPQIPSQPLDNSESRTPMQGGKFR